MDIGGTLSLGTIGRAAWIALRRFPAPIAAAAAAAIVRATTEFPEFPDWLFWLCGAFFWSLAAALLIEARGGAAAPLRVAAPWAAGALAVAVPAWLGGPMSAVYTLPPAGFLAAVAAPVFASATDPWASAAAWIRAVARVLALSAAATLISCGGLTALVGGIDLLFDTALLSAVARPIWSVGLCLLMPWCGLALLPRPGDAGASPAFARWVIILVDWVAAPLALAYGAMLNVYCLTVLVRMELPKGVVGGLVTAFAVAGGVVWALASAAEAGSGRTGRLLRRGFLPGLIAPAVALLVAAWMRIEQHGVTEERYLLVLAGVLLLALAAVQLARRRVPSPSLAALVGAGALLAASLGPWGATAISVHDQFDRLRTALDRSGRMEGGAVVPGGAALSQADAVEISSRVLFLVERGAQERVLGLFRTPPAMNPVPLEDWESRDPERVLARQIVEAMGVEFRLYAAVPEIREDGSVASAWSRHDEVVDPIGGFDHLVVRHLSADEPVVEADTPDGTFRLVLEPDGGLVRAERGGTALAVFDLSVPLRLDPGPPSIVLDEVGAEGTRLRLLVRSARMTKGPADAFRVDDVILFLLIGTGTEP